MHESQRRSEKLPRSVRSMRPRRVPKVGRARTLAFPGPWSLSRLSFSADRIRFGWPKIESMNAPQLQFLMLLFAGWVNRHQQDVIEYLQEENRALREQLGPKRLRSRIRNAVDLRSRPRRSAGKRSSGSTPW